MIGCARGGVRDVHTGAGVEGVDSNVPVAVANLTNVVAIDMFNGHVCALVASGSVRCSAEPSHRRHLRTVPRGCICRRMPRMQVYLPEELYRQVKTRGLAVSELLQKALAAEMRRQDLLAETEKYLAGLTKRVGEPSPAEQARADAWVRKAARRPARKAG